MTLDDGTPIKAIFGQKKQVKIARSRCQCLKWRIWHIHCTNFKKVGHLSPAVRAQIVTLFI